jgi:hypothetical protein
MIRAMIPVTIRATIRATIRSLPRASAPADVRPPSRSRPAVILRAILLSCVLPPGPSPRAAQAAGSLATGGEVAVDRLVARRIDRLLQDLDARAERASRRGRAESPESLRDWLLPRLEEIGATPESLAPRALETRSRRSDADVVIRLALGSLSDRPPEIEPAAVTSVLRSRPEYPANPAASSELLQRLHQAPAIATISARRAPALAKRILALEAARADVEASRESVARLREWTRDGLAAIPDEIGAAALVLADLEELAALARRGWPTARAKRRRAESIDEAAEVASPPTIEFLLAAIDGMPDVANRAVRRVDRRGDGGLRLEFARCSIGEADRTRWRQRLCGRCR